MKSTTLRATMILVMLIGAIAGCSSKSPSASSAAAAPIAARDRLIADIHQCSQRSGYDPAHVQGVAENALAPQELPWRQCAYDAVRAYEQANPALSSRYEQLIAEDIQMTTAIQQGSLTRSERRTRIEALLAQIRSAEEAQANAAAVEQARQMEQIRNVVDSARGFGY
jgi:hypothetical protein